MFRAFNIFQVYQYSTYYRQYFLLKFEHFHEYLIQYMYSLKSGGTKYHFRWVKVLGITPYWKACMCSCIFHVEILLIKFTMVWNIRKKTSTIWVIWIFWRLKTIDLRGQCNKFKTKYFFFLNLTFILHNKYR
jgi:hypothetical protein